MAEVVVSEFMDEASVADLRRDFAVHYDRGLADRPGELAGLLGDCRGLIVRNRTQVRGALLDAAPGLLVVGRLGVGLDNIDLDACSARGIEVCPATGANDEAVAEYVVAAALVLLRGGAWFATEAVRAGLWPREAASAGREVAGKRIGLVGLGRTAREVARRARALGMEVAAFDPHLPPDDPAWRGVAPVDLATLAARSDVLSLHVPLTPETRHLASAGLIARMRPGAILVNAARGGVVDEAALAEALSEGRLGGAALDVFEVEPLTPEAGAVFAGVPNLILTPHVAGVTAESNVRVSAVTAASVRRVLRESAATSARIG